MKRISGWRISVDVPLEAIDIFDRALASISTARSNFEIKGYNLWRIEAFSISRPDGPAIIAAIALAAKLANIPEPDIHVNTLPTSNWVEENLKSFTPILVGRFFIHPTYYSMTIPSGVTSVRIDAGTAFGTGAHGSTKGCLMALDSLSLRRPPRGPILDLGCGSGILAVAVARRWHTKTLTLDIDPNAIAMTRTNARVNGVSRLINTIKRSGLKSRTVKSNSPYSLIVANILARPLIEMSREVTRAIKPGGVLILSGFTRNQENAVRAAYSRRHYYFICKKYFDGWTTFVLMRF